MTAKIIQFPKCIEPKCTKCNPEGEDIGPVKTVVISDSVFAAPPEAFKWPSAGPVDSRYEKALEEQKKRQNEQ